MSPILGASFKDSWRLVPAEIALWDHDILDPVSVSAPKSLG